MNIPQFKTQLKRLGIGPSEFAEQIGVHWYTVNRWMRKNKSIPHWAQNFLKALIELQQLRKMDEWMQEALFKKLKSTNPKRRIVLLGK